MKDNAEKQMIVGYGITIEGKIENCDRLILDGNMNCELNNLQSLIISETGYFQGKGQVQEAEISGRVEGELIVDGLIIITETGRIDGKITYGSIEIKPGGKFTGEIILKDPSTRKGSKVFEPDSNSPDFLDQALQGRIMGGKTPEFLQ